MGKIKKILENELVGGTQSTDVYPVTSTKAVYDENNKRLDEILSASDENLTELESNINDRLATHTFNHYIKDFDLEKGNLTSEGQPSSDTVNVRSLKYTRIPYGSNYVWVNNPLANSYHLNVFFYDENEVYISKFNVYSQSSTQEIVPSNAAFYKILIWDRPDMTTVVNSNICFSFIIRDKFLEREFTEKIENLEGETQIINGKIVVGVSVVKNKGYINPNNGSLVYSEYVSCTDYIDIYGCDKIALNMLGSSSSTIWGLAFYDKDRAYINGIPKPTADTFMTIDVPTNAVFCRATWYPSSNEKYNDWSFYAYKRAEEKASVSKVNYIEKRSYQIVDNNNEMIEDKVNAILNCMIDLIPKIVFHSGTPYEIPKILESPLKLKRWNFVLNIKVIKSSNKFVVTDIIPNLSDLKITEFIEFVQTDKSGHINWCTGVEDSISDNTKRVMLYYDENSNQARFGNAVINIPSNTPTRQIKMEVSKDYVVVNGETHSLSSTFTSVTSPIYLGARMIGGTKPLNSMIAGTEINFYRAIIETNGEKHSLVPYFVNSFDYGIKDLFNDRNYNLSNIDGYTCSIINLN